MTNVKINCPKCNGENFIDIFKAKEGSKVMCKACRELITLHFSGKTPNEIVTDIEGKLRKVIPKNVNIRL
jgi:transposase-like protein